MEIVKFVAVRVAGNIYSKSDWATSAGETVSVLPSLLTLSTAYNTASDHFQDQESICQDYRRHPSI